MLVWGMLLLTLTAALGSYLLAQAVPRAAEQEITRLNFPVPEFTLTNQDGRVVTRADLRGKVWVGDIVFTRCAGPCPVMTKKLSDLQPELLRCGNVELLTLTTDPEFDSPKEMQRFGERFNADFAHWLFLTGTKKEIARLAVDGLKLVAIEKTPDQRENPEDLFIHSTRFVIVDKQGVMRASLDSNDPQIKGKVLKVVRKLLRE